MQALIEELNQTKQMLIDVVASLSDDKIDAVPFEGSWTAGQVLEHIDKSLGAGILNGNVKLIDRAADEKAAMIKKVFLDLTTKYEAPGFIIPTETLHDKQAQISKLTHKFDKLIAAAGTLNLGEECLDFEVPGFGTFTRLEWMSFYIMHTQRHIQQLKNIAAKLNEGE